VENTIDINKLQEFLPLELISKQVVEGFITGLHKSPFHGFSVEFAEHRLYNTGESIKHIDWKLYGRTDRFYVKRYEEETNLRCQIIIDNSSSMYFPLMDKPSLDNPNKIVFSIYAAAALMNLLKKQRDAVGLSLFSDTVEQHTPTRSTSTHIKFLYTELERLLHPAAGSQSKKTMAADALHQISENIHKRSLVIIFSDMFESSAGNEELFSALQHLRHNKHEVLLFHVTDHQKEINFDYDNRPYKFIDMEDGREIKIHPHEVRAQYVKSIGDFKKELELRCGQYQIDFIDADIRKGFRQILMPYLLKRVKMH
jgi:uncharacterized protein (DUF58 family)